MSILVLTEKELRACIALDREMIDSMRKAFTALANGSAIMPPILRLDVTEQQGEMDVKTAYLKDMDAFALKVSTGFFNNPQQGLPSLSGMMSLFSSKTGRVLAVLLDNGYLTDIRTAAAGGLSVELLARKEVSQLGILGTGLQARLQLQAALLVRDFTTVRVWGRNTNKAKSYADEMQKLHGIEIKCCDSAEEVVRGSDVVISTTPAQTPIIEADWLHPGLHITAMGSDAEHKNEVAPEALARADIFVCDNRAQSARLGELHHALQSGAVPEDFSVVELGEITGGTHKGRTEDTQITLCDLSGTGAQDTVIALHAYEVARGREFGTLIND